MEAPSENMGVEANVTEHVNNIIRWAIGIAATGFAMSIAIATSFDIIDINSDDLWDNDDPLASRDS